MLLGCVYCMLKNETVVLVSLYFEFFMKPFHTLLRFLSALKSTLKSWYTTFDTTQFLINLFNGPLNSCPVVDVSGSSFTCDVQKNVKQSREGEDKKGHFNPLMIIFSTLPISEEVEEQSQSVMIIFLFFLYSSLPSSSLLQLVLLSSYFFH